MNEIREIFRKFGPQVLHIIIVPAFFLMLYADIYSIRSGQLFSLPETRICISYNYLDMYLFRM